MYICVYIYSYTYMYIHIYIGGRVRPVLCDMTYLHIAITHSYET